MKREDQEKMIAYGCILPFMVCLAIFVVAVMRAALAHADEQARIPQVEEPAGYSHGPPIPKCDKELWLRIKDGCNEEDDEDGS